MGGERYEDTLLQYLTGHLTGSVSNRGGHPPATKSTRFPPMDPLAIRRRHRTKKPRKGR